MRNSFALAALLMLACQNPPPGGSGGGSGGGVAGTTGGGTAATGGGSSATGGGTSGTGGGTTGGGTGGTGGGTTTGTGGGTTTGTGGGTSGTGGGIAVPDGGFANIVRFVAIGDTGHGNQSQRDVGTAIANWCANATHPCDFVVMLGDNIYDTGVDSATDLQWGPKFEVPYAAVNLPFWAVLGNHDYGGGGAGSDKAQGQHEVDYANLPGQTKFKMPAKHYHFTAGHAEFFATDTNEALWSDLPVTLGFDDTIQRADLLAWTTASTATWKIAMGHHPYKSNGPHGNAGLYDGVPFSGGGVKKLVDDRVCGKVDVYLSGHDHSMQWITSQCTSTELLVSGGGSSSTTLTTTNATHYQTDKNGFIYIQLMDRTFSATFVDSMGNNLYSRSFAK